MLERGTSVPLHEQLKNLITKHIKEGVFRPDQQIPSERELCEKYGVSRITVRQAINDLVNSGLLYRAHGKGTYVSNPKIEVKLSSMINFQQTLMKQGFVASTRMLKTEQIPNDFFLSRVLNVNMVDQITNLQLVGLGNDSPVVFYDSYFGPEIGPKMVEAAQQEIKKNAPFSTLDLYQYLNITPTHVEQTFEAVAVSEDIAGILQVEPKFSVLLVTSVLYDGERPLEYRTAYYRGDKYKFFLTRQLT